MPPSPRPLKNGRRRAARSEGPPQRGEAGGGRAVIRRSRRSPAPSTPCTRCGTARTSSAAAGCTPRRPSPARRPHPGAERPAPDDADRRHAEPEHHALLDVVALLRAPAERQVKHGLQSLVLGSAKLSVAVHSATPDERERAHGPLPAREVDERRRPAGAYRIIGIVGQLSDSAVRCVWRARYHLAAHAKRENRAFFLASSPAVAHRRDRTYNSRPRRDPKLTVKPFGV